MRSESVGTDHRRSRTFLAFLALLFSILLCFASFQGGAFGAVRPLVSPATHVMSHLLINEKGSKGIELHNLRVNQQVSTREAKNQDVTRFLSELDRIVASRLAVDRAA